MSQGFRRHGRQTRRGRLVAARQTIDRRGLLLPRQPVPPTRAEGLPPRAWPARNAQVPQPTQSWCEHHGAKAAGGLGERAWIGDSGLGGHAGRGLTASRIGSPPGLADGGPREPHNVDQFAARRHRGGTIRGGGVADRPQGRADAERKPLLARTATWSSPYPRRLP